MSAGTGRDIRTDWRGEEIPLLARILQVADIYDALTTARPYKPAFSHQHAIEIMLEEARRGWRDPELVPLFAEVSQHQVSQHGDTAALWPGNVDAAIARQYAPGTFKIACTRIGWRVVLPTVGFVCSSMTSGRVYLLLLAACAGSAVGASR